MSCGDDEPEVVQWVRAKIMDEGRKGYYGPDALLMLMSDGTVRWDWDED